MNTLSDARQVRSYLRDIGRLTSIESAVIERCPGGVSGYVWKIESTRGVWVLKQPLEKLATEEEWISDPQRLDVEVAALRRVGEWFPEAVPVVLHHDTTDHVCLMSCAPNDAIPWKSAMMAGRFDSTTASAAGKLLRDIHRESTLRQESVRPEFDDVTFFNQLRIEPFHRFLINRYQDLEGPIDGLISDLTDRRTALVHGDFSPKNMLVRPSGELILLDFEVSHWGNPTFDVAYCLAHLMLKGWAVGPPSGALACIESFLGSYSGSDGASVSRLLPHLGLMLLARLDGKSPVSYLQDPALRATIRDVAVRWIGGKGIQEPMSSIAEALSSKKRGGDG